ncbi:hypothetical protein RB195_001049 [Necator americanus]|uniref:Endonuclease/exonuclease/phosphatase domain-containing protein n=1 Tax=Necator americanus TaxID=51031 RepID=A0ABR1DCG2_NECAM
MYGDRWETTRSKVAQDVFDVDHGDACPTRHEGCLKLCSYKAITVPANTNLRAILGAAEQKMFRRVGDVGLAVQACVIYLVDSHEILSPRLAILRLRDLRQKLICIINCYSPTLAAESKLESFYKELDETISNEKSFYKFAIGDFNAIIDKATDEEYGMGRLEWETGMKTAIVLPGSCPSLSSFMEDLSKYRQKKILEAAQRRTSLRRYRRDLREHNIPLAALLSEDGTRTSSRREMKIITERFYANLLRSSTPVPSPIIPTGETPSLFESPFRNQSGANLSTPLELPFDMLVERVMQNVYQDHLRAEVLPAFADDDADASYVRTLANRYYRCTTAFPPPRYHAC